MVVLATSRGRLRISGERNSATGSTGPAAEVSGGATGGTGIDPVAEYADHQAWGRATDAWTASPAGQATPKRAPSSSTKLTMPIGRAGVTRAPVQVADIQHDAELVAVVPRLMFDRVVEHERFAALDFLDVEVNESFVHLFVHVQLVVHARRKLLSRRRLIVRPLIHASGPMLPAALSGEGARRTMDRW